MSSALNQLTVGYWNIRGLAAPIRMMVMYGGATLNSVNYDLKVKPEGGFDGSCWFDVKPDLKAKNPLINLPYVIDGDVILTQSNACCLYVGRKLGLLGTSEMSLCQCEQLLMEVMDVRNAMVQFAYDHDAKPETLYNKATSKTGNFHKLDLWLQHEINAGRSGLYLVDDTVTAPDFHLYEMLDQYARFCQYYSYPSILDIYPNLAKFKSNFESLPKNQKYLSSALAKLPMNNKGARFGATPNGDKWTLGMEYDYAESTGLY